MKLGIITIQKCDNFGADLQAYALGAKLRALGFDAENIDYLHYKHPRHLRKENLKCGVEVEGRRVADASILPISPVNRIKEALFPIVSRIKGLKHRRQMATRHAKFAAWENQHLKCGPEYRSVVSLYANPPCYDVYMVGSDQVWNPRTASNILPYFLDFVPCEDSNIHSSTSTSNSNSHPNCTPQSPVRFVSYAASFGVSELPTPAFLMYRELLRRFSHIGLRESRGVELVKRMRLDAEVEHVLDPTLLLTAEEWAKVSCEPPSTSNFSSYLLLYDLVASPETVAFAERVAAARGLKVVRVGDGAYGPGEFIWLFAHASCVVTNSFHGTAFSLIHEKDFVSVVPRGMKNASRIESILKVVGLESQLVHAEIADRMSDLPQIDWACAKARLAHAREASVEFLVRAVKGENRVSPRRTIGHVPSVSYAVWNDNALVRAESTSGGIFTWLAEGTICNGGVVYGAAFDVDFKHVHHVAAETMEALAPIRKSKYVYSDATMAIREAVAQLRAGREVLFSGCPCQCAAMKAAARDCSEKLITVDFVCHGTPRPEVFAAYVSELEKHYGGKLTRYEFRNKDRGWNSQNIYYEFDNGKKRRVIPWIDPYFHGFSVNAFLRSGCYLCPFATLERVSDITIGDCWRVAASHPQWDDNRGTSLILGNTDKGIALLETLGIEKLSGGAYSFELAEKRNAALMQPATRGGFESQFDEIFARTGSFAQASSIYMTRKRILKYRLIYWIKRMGWFYFKRHQ